jgi:hypothetical protein
MQPRRNARAWIAASILAAGPVAGAAWAGAVVDDELVGRHADLLTGLQPSTDYYYRVYSHDAAGYGVYSPIRVYRTLPVSSSRDPGVGGRREDTRPPAFLEELRAVEVTRDSASCWWPVYSA